MWLILTMRGVVAGSQSLSRCSHDFCMTFSSAAGVTSSPRSLPFTPESAGKQLEQAVT